MSASISDPTVIKGAVPSRSGRRPKTISGKRVCAEAGCETFLNRYNRHDRCYPHQQTKFGRVRGRNPLG